MNKDQHLSHKAFEGYDLFRIHDIIDGTLNNLRAVRYAKGKCEVVLDTTPTEADFLFDEGDIHLYAGDKAETVMTVLKAHEEQVEKHLKSIMNQTAYVDVDTLDIRTIAGHTYALFEDDRGLGVPRVNYAFGASDGRLVSYGPVPNDWNLTSLILDLIESPAYDEHMYQTGASEYLVLKEHKGVYVSVPLFLHEEESGQLGWASDVKYFRYFLYKDGNASQINKPDTVFTKDEDAQEFMKNITTEIGERVLKQEPSK